MVRQEMITQNEGTKTEADQTIDVETMTGELQVIDNSVQKVEVVQSTAFSEMVGQTNQSKALVYSNTEISSHNKKLMEKMLQLHMEDYDIEWIVE